MSHGWGPGGAPADALSSRTLQERAEVRTTAGDGNFLAPKDFGALIPAKIDFYAGFEPGSLPMNIWGFRPGLRLPPLC